jgi:hypothetical protein
MRSGFRVVICLAALIGSALLGAGAQSDKVSVRLRLLDGDRAMAGLVRISRDGQLLELPELFDRLRGVKPEPGAAGWRVVPATPVDVVLPRGRLKLEAVSGLETVLTRRDLDLTGDPPATVDIPLTYLFRPAEQRLVAGNTHLHLRGLTRKESDEYLQRLPVADGLRVLFISHLRRHQDDASYITNGYPIGDLQQFDTTGVLVSNGEEHRHNFQPYGEGYGHVMFLGIGRLVEPVSLGPGITGVGTDDRPLAPGLAEARQIGGTTLWCHNTNGFEDVPSAMAGRVDALNVWDGSRTGTYEDTYYRFLNVGLKLPLSTGTDWFLYDFARVYAALDGPVTIKSWLAALRSGRCLATNGPLLTMTVDRESPGVTLRLDKPRSVRVEARAVGRHDFTELQLVHNGRVLRTTPSQKDGGGFVSRMTAEVPIDQPGWLAVRITSKTTNELGARLFAHSSPVYLELAGERPFDIESARALLQMVEHGRTEISARGQFSGEAAKARVLAVYDSAARDLTDRINRRSP